MGGFKLTKWVSSSKNAMESISYGNNSKAVKKTMLFCDPQERVLGVSWNVGTDEFFFKVSIPEELTMKPGMLAVTHSLYNPSGLVTPVVLLARILYSEVCRQKLGWDEPIADSFLKRWLCWVSGLNELQNVRIPRSYRSNTAAKIQLQLHFFLDASNIARGTVCYVQTIFPDSSISCSLVMSKSHICGAGRNSIPRAELEAALDSIKHSQMIKRDLMPQSYPCYFWTDSTIVLHSLNADSKQNSQFPRNRLQRILTHSKVYDWRIAGSKSNPADRLTRGTTAKRLVKDQFWFSGPRFLYLSPDKWPLRFHPKSDSDTIY